MVSYPLLLSVSYTHLVFYLPHCKGIIEDGNGHYRYDIEDLDKNGTVDFSDGGDRYICLLYTSIFIHLRNFRLKIKIMAKQRQRLVEVPFNKTDCGVDFYINTAYGLSLIHICTGKGFQISYEGNYGIEAMYKSMEMLNAAEYIAAAQKRGSCSAECHR